MMFFKRRRDRRASWPISGQGGRPDGSRPTPKQLVGTRETYVVERKSLHDRRVSAALATGLDDNRGTLEIKIGEMQAILTMMVEHGEVSQDACDRHARNFYEAMKVR